MYIKVEKSEEKGHYYNLKNLQSSAKVLSISKITHFCKYNVPTGTQKWPTLLMTHKS